MLLIKKSDLNSRLKFGTDDFYIKLRKEISEADFDSDSDFSFLDDSESDNSSETKEESEEDSDENKPFFANIYEELYYVVKNDVMPHIASYKALENDWEDIVLDINEGVWKGLPILLNNPEFFPMTEEEWEKQYNTLIASGKFKEDDKNIALMPPELRRQAWLAKITQNKLKAYYRRHKKHEGEYVIVSIESLIGLEMSKTDKNPQREVDEAYLGKSDSGEGDIDKFVEKDPKLLQEAMEKSAENESNKNIPSAILVERLEYLYSLDVDSEKLMGFSISNISTPLAMGKFEEDKRVRSGKPSDTCNRMYGKTLGEVFDIMKSELEESLEKELPEFIYSKLEKKLDSLTDGARERDKVFTLTAVQISDAAFHINNTIDKDMENIHTKDKKKEPDDKTTNEDDTNNKNENKDKRG